MMKNTNLNADSNTDSSIESNIESSTQAAHCGQSCFSIRCFDFTCALLMLLLSSPFILYGYLKSAFTQSSAFETVYIHGVNHKIIGLKQLSYSGWFKQLPVLLNLLNGELSILGTEQKFALTKDSEHDSSSANKAVIDSDTATRNDAKASAKTVYSIKPGLTSIEKMNAATGLQFELASNSLDKAHRSLVRYLLALLRLTIVFTVTGIAFSKPRRHDPKISVFGISIDNWSMTQLLDEILLQCQHEPQPMQQYAFINTDCLNISIQDESYRQCLQQSKHIFADGIGVRLACLSKGKGLQDNLNGTDMFPRLCELASKNNLSIFMLGGSDNVAQSAASNMQNRYQDLKIAGCHSGYFNSETNSDENQGVIDIINQSNADILLVAMGAPKQELWLAANKQKLTCSVGVGVGGLFDFYANRIKRAPLWLRQIGFEWSYRLLQEPKRMWKRYILGNPSFLYRVWRENCQLKTVHVNQQASGARNDAKLTKLQLQTELNKATIKNRKLPQFDANQANLRRAMFNINKRISQSCKRLLDILISGSLLIALAPFLIVIALLIRCESKGAVLFCQPRAGLNNRPFTMWKFHSMYHDAEQRLATLNVKNEMEGGVIFKIKNDPRITLVGRLIRKTSIDELPQLWNVLKGDMSLVGPRPALVSEVKQYNVHHRGRLMIKPGITCIWQVSGRSTIPFEQQVELDIDYIYQQSFTADLLLLLKTIPAVIFARGAY
ncbi:glycosyl transferase, WecB/TagA/CpsF family [Shewanella halifaxensis HAW-EB4]|uniref:Glycosyl transferase, WecB/TagA/CpsF family n=1 Tax=Shewanella halifaxensis (strain HAW-EB4) TaxID=458817 RepID=B0TN87_SHEHH|nr:WecB/TagA/CpsF family glycosyltransferase [Shewanella halifaxensis]ABZ76073.1 glycosyl transferase, WecB/TagA/CpsF family [Shewanella halifaxensis HAW-EB4]